MAIVVSVLLALLLVPTGATAQGPQPVVNLQLDLSDPGARSLGFGGAFVALADDATAAFANPAGLVQLVAPELSIEVRRSSYSTPFRVGGRLEGGPSGNGLDRTFGLRTARSEETVTGLSFLSLAYPKGKWSIAFFRHQLADLRFSGETQGLFGGGTDCCQIRFLDQRTTNEFDFVNYGIAGAYRVNEALSLGIGLTYLEASLLAVADVFLPDDDSLESIFGRNSYLPERRFLTQNSVIEDSDWTVSAGFLWTLSPSWKVGGVYREGPKVDTEIEILAGSAIDLGVAPGEVLLRSQPLGVEFPWVVGLGFSYRAPGDRLTLSFQWDHIEYSTIVSSLGLDDQAIDDAEELHLGGEYVFPRSAALIALRAGVWLDPDHQLRANSSSDRFLSALLPKGEDEMHYAMGLGVAFKRLQVDLGIDLSDLIDTGSVSAIYSF